jgi:cytochrome c-type biogenesis protein CcmH/NrfF
VMSDCLPCDINDLVREHVEGGTNDLGEIASMMAESVADLVLLAPEEDRATLLAFVLPAFGPMCLETSRAFAAMILSGSPDPAGASV